METIWSRLSWPQVVAFSVMVVGALIAVIFVPVETWSRLPWEAIAGIVAMLVSGGASAFLDRAVRPRSASQPPPLPPRDRKNGSVDVEALRWVIAWALALGAAIWAGVRSGVFHALLLIVVCSGCSASAMRAHRIADAVTSIALSSGRSVLDTAGAEVLAACNSDEACEEERKRTIDDARAAFDLADVARGAYHVAIGVAREALDGDILAALGVGAAGLLEGYMRARAALCRLGYELPAPPVLLVQAVEWASSTPLPDVPDCVLPTTY